MHRAFRFLVVVGLMAPLSGCAVLGPRLRGVFTPAPETPLHATGPIQTSCDNASSPNSPMCLLNEFRSAHNSSADCRAGRDACKDKAESFLRLGFTASDSLCNAYFEALGGQQQAMDMWKDVLAIAAPAATGAMGVTGASDKAIALLSAGFAALIGLSNAYERNYIFGPDVDAVHQLVQNAQKTAQDLVEQQITQGAVYSYTSATQAIEDFQINCQVERIKSYVNAAVAQGRLKERTDEDREKLRQFQDGAMVRNAARALDVPMLSVDQVMGLYWLIVQGADEKYRKLLAENQLKDLASKVGLRATGAFTPNATATEVSGALQGLSDKGKKELVASIDATKKKWDEAQVKIAELQSKGAPGPAVQAQINQLSTFSIVSPANWDTATPGVGGGFEPRRILLRVEN